jgi:3-oxoacyl-(acyl-carrier-protein) synthase
MGEGAGILVIESLESAQARGAQIFGMDDKLFLYHHL